MRLSLHLSAVTVLVSALAGRAAVWEVSAHWLDDNRLVLQAGDEGRVTGSPDHPHVNLGNVDWQGGTLTLDGCRLVPDAGRTPPGLPLVVHEGQVLNLIDSWIEGAEQAIVLAGGEANLTQVTLAATEQNIQSTHPASRLTLQDVNICVAETGLALDSVDTVLIQGTLFLTNITALRIGQGSLVQLEDCLFQGNEWDIRVGAAAQPPLLLDDVDLVDCRHAHVENVSPLAMDLGNAHLSHPEKLIGLWQRNGVDPGAPAHPLKAALPPLIDDEDLVDIVLPNRSSCVGTPIPCVISKYRIYVSYQPYNGFVSFYEFNPGHSVSLSANYSGGVFYRITANIGSWGIER
ncbi:MAG: hypothetical protein Q8O14_03315 [bacterium]|nr:hypothetical protein [bacterium]